MNLSIVQGIYTPIGKSKFNSLMRHPKKKERRKTKVIAAQTVDKISKLIERNKKVTRDYLFENSGNSKSTSEMAIRILFEKGTIRKERNKMLPNHPVIYVWND